MFTPPKASCISLMRRSRIVIRPVIELKLVVWCAGEHTNFKLKKSSARAVRMRTFRLTATSVRSTSAHLSDYQSSQRNDSLLCRAFKWIHIGLALCRANKSKCNRLERTPQTPTFCRAKRWKCSCKAHAIYAIHTNNSVHMHINTIQFIFNFRRTRRFRFPLLMG